jgi:PadR family transcriptional regulator PadR
MVFQVGATLLDACVLSILKKKDTYGYDITHVLSKTLDEEEITLYPVLKRLEKAGALTTYDKAIQGRNRRYYQLTETGEKIRKKYMKEWGLYKKNLDKILIGGKK